MSVQEKLSGSWVASLVDESAKGCDVGLVNKRQIGSLLQEYCTEFVKLITLHMNEKMASGSGIKVIKAESVVEALGELGFDEYVCKGNEGGKGSVKRSGVVFQGKKKARRKKAAKLTQEELEQLEKEQEAIFKQSAANAKQFN